MCNCIKIVSAKLETKLKKQIGPIEHNVYSFDQIGFNHQSLLFGTGEFTGMAIGLPFSIEFYRKKKDGSRATARTKKEVTIFMTYCPFCGEKYPQPKE